MDKKAGQRGTPSEARPAEEHFAVIVSGREITIKIKRTETLHTLIERALDEAGSVGQPIENWTLRYEQQQLTDWSRTVGFFDFPKKAKLWLDPKTGVTG